MIRVLTSDSQSELLSWLSLPSTYDTIGKVERIDTHISSIFLVDDRAYKLKRAVFLPFLDFTTLEQRRIACERELVINQRVAPEIYLGLISVTRKNDGNLEFDGHGKILDWLIVMKQFKQDNLFNKLADNWKLSINDVCLLADVIADFHRSSELQTTYGGEIAIRSVIDGNAVSLAKFVPFLFDPIQVERVIEQSKTWLINIASELEKRRVLGFVRKSHGDLHLGNICLFNGKPTLFDAIEFNEDFACIDVFYDLAFLIMDFEMKGLFNFASIVFNRYLERTGDLEAVSVLPLFLSLRACIRAHILAETATVTTNQNYQNYNNAKSYLAKSLTYLTPSPPCLLAIGGLSGSGKSTLASNLAPFLGASPGAVLLRSDVLRKRLAGIDSKEHLSEAGYTIEMTKRTYNSIYEHAEQILKRGHSVIVDAVFFKQYQRDDIEAVARRVDIPFEGIWLFSTSEILHSRIKERFNDVSDATVSTLEQQLISQLEQVNWKYQDTSNGIKETFMSVRKSLKIFNPNNVTCL
ncbi:MAG: AAA family ATPase [Rhodospirillaceae bacterium]|jgi:aminoglycoside phosphotransferase family enzyme/predicted kinase|nr:AAA family ATPase [Rhodospirillaceae bacterium]